MPLKGLAPRAAKLEAETGLSDLRGVSRRVRRSRSRACMQEPPAGRIGQELMATIRIVLADDTLLVRRLLAVELARQPDFAVVGEAGDGREVLDMVAALRPDVALLDLDMPIVNGIQATEKILARHPSTRVVLLTGHDDLTSIGRLAGACGCLNKGCTPQELFEAIRHAHASRGSAHPDGAPSERRLALEHLGVRAGLTAIEAAVLERLVGGDQTIGQIAAALAAERGRRVTESAVKHTTDRLMTKLRVEPRTRAALVKCVLEYEKGIHVDAAGG
jgi:DNA-binding NarL/FixJ family response regulator